MSLNNEIGDSNPFSFKKYVKNPNIIPSPEIPDDLMPDNPLQNEIKTKENPFSFKNFLDIKKPIDNQVETTFIASKKKSVGDDDDDIFSDVNLKPRVVKKTELKNIYLETNDDDDVIPDFGLNLNDKAVNSDQTRDNDLILNSLDDLPSAIDISPTTDSFLIVDLNEQLNSKQQIINHQKAKIDELEKKIKDLVEKEKNENRTLEKIVKQVEENLVKTTKRAIESERNAELLKQEIIQLKSHVQVLANENKMLKLSSHGRNDKLNLSLANVSNQINIAATGAEDSLRKLLSGVDQLRLIAGNLESLTKIQEINTESI